jgi:hypothetical protein
MLSTSRSMHDETLHKTCPCCGLEAERVFGDFAFKRFAEHYSPAVGKVVSSDREFRDDLKRASEEATIRTGIVHDFQPIDITEHAPKNLEGLEATHRKHRELGLTERKTSFFSMPESKTP